MVTKYEGRALPTAGERDRHRPRGWTYVYWYSGIPRTRHRSGKV